ncbi:hypothetical protein KIK06_23300 [Nocardiopsis sp. EMB25]|uniref:hypothetical protein n=1 Tax=Nocardiopsis sp. EMB25 TaxID=2835867 RepID=UPI002284176E|nr:hypothetical protein [Nocardiopsis sp. EMB25]MCY9786813.1 hypothetical protein [Nocardiopsis sp. EMB25]
MRYLRPDDLDRVRHRAAAMIRNRRPRRASRPRPYVTWPGGDLAPLTLAVRGLLALRGAA